MKITSNTNHHTDIKKLVWIEQLLPKYFRPYAYLMRIDRPIGIWLLLLPALWSILLASGGIYNIKERGLYYIILFIIGAIIMRSAGCIINDLWDKDLDKKVERTKNRPLASGELSSKQGLAFLASLLLLGLIILLQFNITTIILGFISIPLIISYPLMKRITWWPQAFLGLTLNFGALMGWSAVTGEISIPAIMLYISGIFWTLGYDTIYAHQDKDDDMLIGIKSTALKLGNNSKLWVGYFYILSILSLFSAIYIVKGISFIPLLTVLPALHFTWQVYVWKPNNQASSLRIFKSNRELSLLILLLFLI